MWKTSDGHNEPVPHSAVAVMTNVVKQTSNQNTAETVRLRFPQLMRYYSAFNYTIYNTQICGNLQVFGLLSLRSFVAWE